jgi:hypothetical protein
MAAPLLRSEHLSAAQTGPAPPTNLRIVTSPPPPTSTSSSRQLLGGWYLPQFAHGCIAIDFSQMKLWMVMGSNNGPSAVNEYNLPAMGTASNHTAWPQPQFVRTIQGWWTGGYANGLIFWRNKLWVTPRFFYATNGEESKLLTLFAQDGEQIQTGLLRQVFSGFVKRGPGLDPYLGSGGYESGQGTRSGPSLATLQGQSLIEYGWPGSPGPLVSGKPANWDQRAPRDPNYYPVGHVDSWVAWEPRTINGVLEGRWACDRIQSGGLVLPEGITYWAWQGTGDLDYARQNSTFADTPNHQVSAYCYDPSTFKLISYGRQPELGIYPVLGQELGPDGKVYLLHGHSWQAVLRVYG